jgi:thiol-disulfide isomerase/thioredoxin
MRIRSRVVLTAVLLATFACSKGAAPQRPAASKRVAKPAIASAPKVPSGSPDVGTPMPAYKALWMDGKEFDLQREHGQVVFLNVWATWCGPCRFEIPELQSLHEKYGKDGFKVIGVSIDDSGADDVKKFVAEQKKMTYPIVIDGEARLANIFQTSVIPTSAVIDRSGKIVWKHLGAVSAGDASLKRAIESALAAKS